MNSPIQGKAILELVLGGRTAGAANEGTDRPYLLLEDLVDEPIHLTLSDFASLDFDVPTSGPTTFH